MCLDIFDEEPTLLLDSGTRRARKEHRCGECRRTIGKGERYQFWVTVAPDIETEKMCAHCWATIDVGAVMAGCPTSWYWGRVFDMDPDNGGFLGDIAVNHELTPRQRAWVRLCCYRGGVRKWRDPSGGLYPVPVAA